MSDSIWRSIDTAEKSDYGKMECMEMTDVAIVGGGLCGILCAWFLKDAGVDCILLDKDRIAGGMGKDAMAQVTSQHGLIYSKLVERDGEEKARMYFQANWQYRSIGNFLNRLTVILKKRVPMSILGMIERSLKKRLMQSAELVGRQNFVKQQNYHLLHQGRYVFRVRHS